MHGAYVCTASMYVSGFQISVFLPPSSSVASVASVASAVRATRAANGRPLPPSPLLYRILLHYSTLCTIVNA
jgi:hypothetical protein